LAEVFGITDVVRPPQMKTKQIPDDFRDWIETRTFEIVAPIAWPPRLPLDYLKRTIIRQPAEDPPLGESRP
jgi:hypothetical protein